jgi:exosortase
MIAMLYGGVLATLLVSCWNESAQSQGILIVPLTAYIVWIRREVTLSRPAMPDNRGLLVIAGAVFLYVVGVLGADLFLPRLSFVALLAGIVWTFWGRSRLCTLAFPLALLATVIPIPALVYNSLSLPLRLLASRAAATIGQVLGVVLYQDGNIIQLARISFGVEEACDGMNALSALLVSSLLLGFLIPSGRRARTILVVLAIPVAISVNIVRIAGTAILADYHEQLALGFYHSFSGWLVFVLGFGVLYGLLTGLNFMEER